MRLIDADAIIEILKRNKQFFIDAWGGSFHAMSEKDKARCDEIDNCIAEILTAPTIEPDGDTISRQDAIDAVNSLTYPSSLMDVKRKLIELPSAEPKTRCIAQIRIDRYDMEDLVNEKAKEIVDKMAEPKTEVVRCKDCLMTEERDEYTNKVWCCRHREYMDDMYYCADGLCREDGEA